MSEFIGEIPRPHRADVEKRARRDRVFLNNPVIMQGLGLAPLIVAATTLKNGVMLSVAVLLLLTPTRVLAALLSRFAYFRFRGLTYALTAAAVFVGVRYVMGLLYPVSDLALLGLYLPLLVADPIVLKRYERPQRERVRTALRKGIITSLGYILMLLLISGLREFLGAGALMGTQVMKNALFPMAQLPSGGFILLALVMCVWRGASMIEVLKALSVFFAYAVMAVFAQNAVFTRALGVSRLVKLVDDTTVDSLTFGALLCAVQLISAPLGYFVNLWLAQYPYRMYIRPLVMVLCSTVAFFIVLLVVVVFFRLHGAREIVAVLPMATFNTCILGTLFISTIQSFSLVQTMGFALGSGVGYVLAVQVVTEGQRKLQSDAVPATFRGLPITLLYIGILALAIYGFTGHMLAF